MHFSVGNDESAFVQSTQDSGHYFGKDKIFKQKPEDIIKDTEFASKFCEEKVQE